MKWTKTVLFWTVAMVKWYNGSASINVHDAKNNENCHTDWTEVQLHAACRNFVSRKSQESNQGNSESKI